MEAELPLLRDNDEEVMAKYRVMWAPPPPPKWEAYAEGLGRDEAWAKCEELWEAGSCEAYVEEVPEKSAVSAWLSLNSKVSSV